MWESRRRADGTWGLQALKTGRWAKDEAGNVLAFASKGEAEEERRDREKGVSGVDRDPGDIFRQRYLTGRFRGR